MMNAAGEIVLLILKAVRKVMARNEETNIRSGSTDEWVNDFGVCVKHEPSTDEAHSRE